MTFRTRLAVFALIVAAAACQRARPHAGSRIAIGLLTSATTLDPHLQDDERSYSTLDHFYDKLVAFGPEMQIVPGLAVRWENVSDTEWRFHLRRGVVFHDGRPFGAEDVRATILRAEASRVDGRLLRPVHPGSARGRRRDHRPPDPGPEPRPPQQARVHRDRAAERPGVADRSPDRNRTVHVRLGRPRAADRRGPVPGVLGRGTGVRARVDRSLRPGGPRLRDLRRSRGRGRPFPRGILERASVRRRCDSSPGRISEVLLGFSERPGAFRGPGAASGDLALDRRESRPEGSRDSRCPSISSSRRRSSATRAAFPPLPTIRRKPGGSSRSPRATRPGRWR